MCAFVPTCPRCGDLQPPGATYRCLACGCVLTITRSQVHGLTLELPHPTVRRRAVDRRPFAARRGPLNG